MDSSELPGQPPAPAGWTSVPCILSPTSAGDALAAAHHHGRLGACLLAPRRKQRGGTKGLPGGCTHAGEAALVRRGHADSVNRVRWQPGSGNLGTASADKSVCLWDARSGLPTLKLYGHNASCNCLAFSPQVRARCPGCLHAAATPGAP